MSARNKKKIIVPKWPYLHPIKRADVLDRKSYLKEIRELSKKRYDVVNFTRAVDLDGKKGLRLANKVRVIYIVDIDDPMVNTALGMGLVNREYGIPCTFNPRLYHVEDEEMDTMIRKMSRIKWQEIGYQYEEVADCDGDIRRARIAFGRNLAYMRSKYQISTLMAHGRSGEGYCTADLFKRQGRYDPKLWMRYSLRKKADFYYFLGQVEGGVYYFNERTKFGADQYIETLRCFNLGDIVIMLHHSDYLYEGCDLRTIRKNAEISRGMKGVDHIFPDVGENIMDYSTMRRRHAKPRRRT